MSREIKFRAWAVDIENGGHKLWKPFSLDWYKEGSDAPDGFTANRYGEWPSDTVFMQYTGLKDKNGKEIYEGDIVKGITNSVSGMWTVLFEDGSFVGTQIDEPKLPMSSRNGSVLEVIGNIYEHPDLINGI